MLSGPQQTAPLFDDTSTQQVGGYGGQQQGYSGFNPAQLASDPMANMAFQYGTSLASQGKDYVDKNVRFLYVTTLYFSQDSCPEVLEPWYKMLGLLPPNASFSTVSQTDTDQR